MVIVPYLLSVWAVYYDEGLRAFLDYEEEEKYLGKADNLYKKGLGNFIESIWNSMIKLWLMPPSLSLTRPSGCRLLTPTTFV